MIDRTRAASIRRKLLNPSKYDGRLGWIEKIKPSNLDNLAQNCIFESFVAVDLESIRLIYQRFEADPKVTLMDLFNLKNQKNQHLLMMAGFLGNREIFIDILTGVLRMYEKGVINEDQIRGYIEKRDAEGNSTLDLTCQRGYYQEDESIFEIKESGTKNFYDNAIKTMNDTKRQLFTTKFNSYESIHKKMLKMKNSSINSRNIFYMTRRSFCVKLLLEFEDRFDSIKLFRIGEYNKKKDNALFFAYFHADFYTCFELMNRHFWATLTVNQQGDRASDASRAYSKINYRKFAIYMSLINELMRVLNIYHSRQHLLSKEAHLEARSSEFASNLDQEYIEKFKEDVKSMRDQISEHNEIEKSNLELYENQFILCDQNLLAVKFKRTWNENTSKYLASKMKTTSCFVDSETDELEALQRIFLDYCENQRKSYKYDVHPVHDIEFILKTFLSWNIAWFGEARIDPKIYTLLKIDPFQLATAGETVTSSWVIC